MLFHWPWKPSLKEWSIKVFIYLFIYLFIYTSQLKYIFWLEEDVSRAVDQNSLTPRETTTFDTHVIRSCSLKPRQSCVPAGFKQTIFTHFFPLDLNVPLGFASGKQTSLFPAGPVVKYLTMIT